MLTLTWIIIYSKNFCKGDTEEEDEFGDGEPVLEVERYSPYICDVAYAFPILGNNPLFYKSLICYFACVWVCPRKGNNPIFYESLHLWRGVTFPIINHDTLFYEFLL